jgi:hypothetical protein
MSDGELRAIAADSDELTVVARQLLEAEIEKRALNNPAEEIDSEEYEEPELELQDLVMLRRYRDLPEAVLAKASLDSSDIKSYLADDNIIRLDWFISNLIGGVKLMVKPEDVEAANQILSQPIPEGIEYGDNEVFEQPKCPTCHSLNISFEALDKTLSYGSLWIGVPIPVASPKWKCADCGAVWKDDIEDPAQLEEKQQK